MTRHTIIWAHCMFAKRFTTKSRAPLAKLCFCTYYIQNYKEQKLVRKARLALARRYRHRILPTTIVFTTKLESFRLAYLQK
jgi:hypothetical protein